MLASLRVIVALSGALVAFALAVPLFQEEGLRQLILGRLQWLVAVVVGAAGCLLSEMNTLMREVVLQAGEALLSLGRTQSAQLWQRAPLIASSASWALRASSALLPWARLSALWALGLGAARGAPAAVSSPAARLLKQMPRGLVVHATALFWPSSFWRASPPKCFLTKEAASGAAALAWMALLGGVVFRRLSRPRAPVVLFFPDKSGLNYSEVRLKVASARRRIWLAMFTFTDQNLSADLILARKRGVDVRIICDDDQMKIDSSEVQHLTDQGIPVVTDCHRSLMHHKFVVFDKSVFTGSFNWTKAARQANCEHICVLWDKKLVLDFAQEFKRLWGEFDARGGRLRPARRRRDRTPGSLP